MQQSQHQVRVSADADLAKVKLMHKISPRALAARARGGEERKQILGCEKKTGGGGGGGEGGR